MSGRARRHQSTGTNRLTFVLAASFGAVLGGAGGSSRSDEFGNVLVALAAIAAIVAACWPPAGNTANLRAPLVFMGAVAALFLMQLIPLPPQLWADLPGHGRFALGLRLLPEVSGNWRPLSLTPDATMLSAIGLLPVFAVLFVLRRLGPPGNRLSAYYVLALCAFSALLGVVQLSGASVSMYRIGSDNSPIGLFANRNHQAVLIASAVPLLAWWGREAVGEKRIDWLVVGGALLAILLAGALVLVTGSRAGLLTFAVTAVGSIPIWGERLRRVRPKEWRKFRWLLPVVIVTVACLLAALTSALGLGESLRRLTTQSFESDARNALLPTLKNMIVDFQPFGSGIASFDAVYKAYEPQTMLSQNYLNQAHIDWLQILLEGGVPGIALVALYLIWWFRRTLAIWRENSSDSAAKGLAKVGALITFAVMLASVSDYPLRTPLIAGVFAIASVWMLTSRSNELRSRPYRH